MVLQMYMKCLKERKYIEGLEYENVAIILGKDFGQDKNLFDLYFKNLGKMKNKLLINMKKAEIYYMQRLLELFVY